MADKSQIVIVLPPFADAANPAIGPSLLATACRKRGLSATVFYANLKLAAELGFDLYQRLALSASRDFIGEAIFQSSAFPPLERNTHPTAAIEYLFGSRHSVESRIRHGARLSKDEVLRCRTHLTEFLEEVVDEILIYDPEIVGFSSVFEQNLASIALVRRVKATAPGVVTVLGGSNADDPMGAALADLVSELDFVFSGEADYDFPEFCENYLRRKRLPERRVIQCVPVENLDEVPVPEYHEYYSQLAPLVEANLLPGSLPEWVHFETSRGCWYGDKSRCKFCGLKALDFGYRAKSPGRAIQEISHLVRQYEPHGMAAVDNIMPQVVRRDVLPMLEKVKTDASFFYEVKANLRAEDLDQFVLSGVFSIQPGIESFSSKILKKVGKGVSGTHNIWLLRECSSRQILLLWNLLTGIPGETRADYEATLQLLPFIEHLEPPHGWGRIRLDRYSPYFTQHEEYGISNVRPIGIYSRLYPSHANLDDLAYHFKGDYGTEFLDDEELPDRLEAALEAWTSAWKERPSRPRLVAMSLGQDRTLVEDTRACAVETFFGLPGTLLALLRRLERPLLRRAITDEDRGDLEELLRRHFVVEHEDRFLSVVTNPVKGAALREQRRPAVDSETSRSTVAPTPYGFDQTDAESRHR